MGFLPAIIAADYGPNVQTRQLGPRRREYFVRRTQSVLVILHGIFDLLDERFDRDGIRLPQMPGLPAVTGCLAARIGRERGISANFRRQQLTKLLSIAVFRRRRQIANGNVLSSDMTARASSPRPSRASAMAL